MKKAFAFSILILVFCQFLFATQVSYRWKYIGTEPIDYYEIRLNGSEWQTVSSNQKGVTFDLTDSEIAALTDTSLEIRSVIGDRKSEIVTVPSFVKKDSENKQMLSVGINPFSFQKFTRNDGEETVTVNTKYGFGGKIDYSFKLENGLTLGAEIQVDSYSLENQKNFTDITFSAKAGYAVELNNLITLNGNIKGGLDIQTHDVISPVFEFGPEIGVEYKINNKCILFASCEMLLGFPRKDSINFTELRFTPTLGTGYTF